jgi:2-keto-3-deoxy-L-rhamnonate aldolase RhmA
MSVTLSLRPRLRDGQPTIGTFLNLGSVLAAEACAMAGFDWLVVDLEHGGGTETQLVGQLLAVAVHGVPVIVRVESAERIRTGRVLDLGAAGVMFPRLDTAQQVGLAVHHLRYPPEGDRGVATLNRAHGFGLRTDFEAANRDVIGVVQIESVKAVEEVDEIARVPGVDVLFVGPQDLSHALGVPGDLSAPAFQAAVETVARAAQRNGLSAGILVKDHDTAERFVQLGFTFIGIGSDSSFVAAGARLVASRRSSTESGSGATR